MFVVKLIDIFVFFVFLFAYLYEHNKNNKVKKEYQVLISELKNEINILKKEVCNLKENITNVENTLNEKINKQYKQVNEFNSDFKLQLPLFLSSLKYLKTTIETLLMKQNMNIQYIYYYLASLDDIKCYDSKYFKIMIFCRKLFDFFDDVKDLKNKKIVFFSEKFKEEMVKLSTIK
jgi:hypothetical protein